MLTKNQTSKIAVYTADSPLKNPFSIIWEAINGAWNSRELTWILLLRNIKAQYRESYFGYLWLIAPPLMTTLVWVFLNAQRIVRVETDIPYPLFVLIGTTVWTSFIATLTAPLTSFNEGKPIFMKLNVAPEAFIFSGFFRSVFDLLIRLLLLIPVFLVFKFVPPVTILLFPVVLFMLLVTGLALGMVLIPIGGFYGDVSQAITTFIGLAMYVTPVVFPVPDNDGLLATVMKLNPLTPVVSLCREVITTGDLSYAIPALIWFGVAVIVLAVGLLVLRVAMPHLIARMGM